MKRAFLFFKRFVFISTDTVDLAEREEEVEAIQEKRKITDSARSR